MFGTVRRLDPLRRRPEADVFAQPEVVHVVVEVGGDPGGSRVDQADPIHPRERYRDSFGASPQSTSRR